MRSISINIILSKDFIRAVREITGIDLYEMFAEDSGPNKYNVGEQNNNMGDIEMEEAYRAINDSKFNLPPIDENETDINKIKDNIFGNLKKKKKKTK
jgi:hypothetical protein